MTEMLWFNDCYLREWDATVTSANGTEIEFDRTAFFPEGGGNPCDLGKILCNGSEYDVISVRKEGGRIIHKLDNEGVKQGDKVHCVIDWNRRYKVMKMHTAMHLISSVFNKESGVLITGNQISPEKSRMDFNLDNFDRSLIEKLFIKANTISNEGHKIKIYFMKREEALKIPGMVKLAGALPPSVDNLRIVEIEGVDTQADGGCHVANTREIGEMKIIKMENKGKSNRRVEFVLD